MNIEEIRAAIIQANWFESVGQYTECDGRLALKDLSAWDSLTFASNIDSFHAKVASQMDWLPSSRDSQDPIHFKKLIEKLDRWGVQYREVSMEVYKVALQSLRSVDNQKLRSGPNDFTEAAKGAALYCVRMAALEALANEPGFWLTALQLYCAGYWPCGLMPGNKLVVY